MDKRTNTVSASIPDEFERQARAIAIASANDQSLSDLIAECLSERVGRELARVERITAALQAHPGLPGKPTDEVRNV